MSKLTKESALKLQKILLKRTGREFSEEELEQAYYSLMGFAEALIDLDIPETTEDYTILPIKLLANKILSLDSRSYRFV